LPLGHRRYTAARAGWGGGDLRKLPEVIRIADEYPNYVAAKAGYYAPRG
jgi:hypothetical protein